MADSPSDRSAPVSRDDLETALQNLYPRLSEGRMAHADVLAMVKALVETLIAGGVVSPEQYEQRRRQALDTLLGRLKDRPTVEMSDDPDKYNLTDLPQVDCASLMPICRARCCSLKVCLTRQDLDERVLSWDYGKPYQIRRRSDGFCTYLDRETRGCTVYAHRPATCRKYDCRMDPRIWLDFDRRILAPDPQLDGRGGEKLSGSVARPSQD
jgi:Fe-S-cluster containining protein